MSFIEIMSLLAAIAAAIIASFFRRGGIYNPDPTDPIEPPVANPPISVSTPDPAPISLPTETMPKTATVTNLCLAIKDVEQANPSNRNPGNCRFYAGGYAPMYGTVKCSAKGFAIFPTYELGWLYLQNLIKGKIHAHPDWTLLQLMENYAPSTDGNNPVAYSKTVALRLGVDNTVHIGDIALV